MQTVRKRSRDVSGPYHSLPSRYHVLESLGAGGMGDVYHVWDRKSKSEAALKVLRRELQENRRVRARLAREVELLSRVTHRNIVQVFASGEESNLSYFTMDFVRGTSLRTILDEGRLELQRAVTLVAELADGICAVHDAGVLHRDIKPENVIVDGQGTPRLIDFGLGILSSNQEVTRLTDSGMLLGTLWYQPPEVIDGRDYDERGDVYQLGLILYEVVTGRLPFRAASVNSILTGKAWRDLVPPSRFRPDVDEVLEFVVTRAIEPRRSERIPSARDLRDALYQWLESKSGPSGRHRCYSRPVTVEPAEEDDGKVPHALPWPLVQVALVLLLLGGLLTLR